MPAVEMSGLAGLALAGTSGSSEEFAGFPAANIKMLSHDDTIGEITNLKEI